MGGHVHAGTQPENGAGILRDVGLVKRDLHSIPIVASGLVEWI
jgi:hypothetical protein